MIENPKWERSMDGTEASYRLTIASSPDWFAVVFKKEGKWAFRFGKRIIRKKAILGGRIKADQEDNYSSIRTYGTMAAAKQDALSNLKTVLWHKANK